MWRPAKLLSRSERPPFGRAPANVRSILESPDLRPIQPYRMRFWKNSAGSRTARATAGLIPAPSGLPPANSVVDNYRVLSRIGAILRQTPRVLPAPADRRDEPRPQAVESRVRTLPL